MTEALLGLDHWQSMSKFLTVREMGRLMCVSRTWFHRWVDDRLWLFQKQRICTLFPSLEPLFDKWQPTEETKKRHRREWCMPRKGIWWGFKRFLYLALNMDGIKALCKKPSCHPLVLAVLSTNIECRELISESNVISYNSWNTAGAPMYDICFWLSDILVSFGVNHSRDWFECRIYYCEKARYNNVTEDSRHTQAFKNWRTILFQKRVSPHLLITKETLIH